MWQNPSYPGNPENPGSDRFGIVWTRISPLGEDGRDREVAPTRRVNNEDYTVTTGESTPDARLTSVGSLLPEEWTVVTRSSLRPKMF